MLEHKNKQVVYSVCEETKSDASGWLIDWALKNTDFMLLFNKENMSLLEILACPWSCA